MRKWVWLATAGVLTLGAPATVRAADTPVATGTIEAAVDAAATKRDNHDNKGAEADLKALMDDPRFAGASTQTRARLLTLLGVCENVDHEPDAALQHLNEAGTINPDGRNRYYWVEMAFVALRLNRDDLLGDALTKAVTIAPDRANTLSAEFISEVLRRLHKLKDGDAHRRQLLEALVEAHYDPSGYPVVGETVRRSLFKLYADAGEDAKARDLLPGLITPASFISLHADNRYRKYVADNANFADFQETIDRYIAYLRSRQASGGLPVAQELALTLAAANRLPEAMQVVDNALALGDLEPGADSPDFGKESKWLLDTRTRILALMGRWDEVEAAQIKARDVALKEGVDQVSQKINLADLYNRLGRPQDALKELSDLKMEGASIYGKMVAEQVRACAYAVQGDKEKLKTSLDTLRAHQDDAPRLLSDALVCTGDEDGAAALLIARLDDPDLRGSELGRDQTYLPAPHPTAFDQMIAAHDANILKRPDVQAAIAKYGVIETYPILVTGD